MDFTEKEQRLLGKFEHLILSDILKCKGQARGTVVEDERPEIPQKREPENLPEVVERPIVQAIEAVSAALPLSEIPVNLTSLFRVDTASITSRKDQNV